MMIKTSTHFWHNLVTSHMYTVCANQNAQEK